MNVPARVRPAAYLHHAALRIGEEAVISYIRIGLQIATIVFQELLRARPLARRCVVIHHRGMMAVAQHTARCALSAVAPIAGPTPSLAYRPCPRLLRPVRSASAAHTADRATARIAPSSRTSSVRIVPRRAAAASSPADA